MQTARSRTKDWIRGWVLTVLAALGWSGTGCATASPTPAAPRVVLLNGVPAPPCRNLGTVIGQSQARVFGTSRDALVSDAMGEAIYRAEVLGATHLFLSPVTVSDKDGAPASATLTGSAFLCPPPSP